MGWSKYLTISLSVNESNAIGASTFNGFGDTYKFPAGQYQIRYNSGGVISYTSNIDNPQYNRYELVKNGLSFGKYTSSFFKEQKRYTWQCMFGVLPGFFEEGFYSASAVKLSVKENDILSFTLNRTSSINFFYTDDCPACADGVMIYDVFRYEESTSYANGITVLTMNVENPFEHETPEFYHHRTPPPPQVDGTIPFTASVWMSHLKEIDVQHIVDIKGFNTLGLKENAALNINKNTKEYYNMDAFPADTLDNRYSQYSYWKIIKKQHDNYGELIAEFTLDNISHINGLSSYDDDKNNIDKYPLWSYDLLPGIYSIVYISGATAISNIATGLDYGISYWTCDSFNKNVRVIDFKETVPSLTNQIFNSFYCEYGALPGVIYDNKNYNTIPNHETIETATLDIQNKILNDEMSGSLEFEVKNYPKHLNIWFNDVDTFVNTGAVTFRLYKGKVNAKAILKEFLSESNIDINTQQLSSDKQILSKSETNKYLNSILNVEEQKTDEVSKTKDAITYQYYVEKINEIIKIIEISLDEEQDINENIIGGPFFTLDEAKTFIANYCKLNDLDYEEIPEFKQYTIALGEL